MVSLLWRITPTWRREMVLGFLTQHQRQLWKKVLSGRLSYSSVYDDKECIFVHVPKTAGLSVCDGILDAPAVGHMPLHYYEKVLGRERYQRYFKFAFVRNPWDRVYSAYNYLKQGGISKDDQVWKQELARYSDFNDFVFRWLDEDNLELSLHFMPQTRFLKNSCGVMDLDFIGRFETLAEDYQIVVQQLGGKPLQRKNSSHRQVGYKDVYSKRSMDIVRRVYCRDIELLGYDFDSFG